LPIESVIGPVSRVITQPFSDRKPDGTESAEGYINPTMYHEVFAADLPAESAAALAVSQRPADVATLGEPSGDPAWANIPTWDLVATQDMVIPPDAQRAMAERAGAVTVPAIIEHFESVIDGLDTPPILIGHSAGGAFVQVLLDHGRGAVGVAINSAPTEGVTVIPLSQIHATFAVLKNPANRHRAVGFTHEQWHYAFTNTFTEEESLALYERYHIPASGHIFWDSVLANITPGHQETWVDYHNDARPPLLFISGSEDNLMPPKIQRSNAKHYKSDTVTEVKLYEGFAHLLPAQAGWEGVADFALDWALEHATQSVEAAEA
jgi:pimeloyl-ACP methyl ester carboxylesterase